MKILRKAITTLGAVFLAALLITALAPRAARGITATIVEITNTGANPVPTVSADANFPYEAVICAGECGPVSFSVPSTTTTGVPVKRLVIEDLNVNCVNAGNPVAVELTVPASADTNVVADTGPISYPFIINFFESGESFRHSTVRIYADPLATVSILSTAHALPEAQCFAVVTGHLETK